MQGLVDEFDTSKNEQNSRKLPTFDPVDSTPQLDDTDEPYKLKLCFCPLCQKGMTVLCKEKSRNVISWQYICRVIFYCLNEINKEGHKESDGFFSLKYDVHWFIVDHWYLFGQLDQFRTNPNKWKKAILDAMIHCNLFESGKSALNKTGVWRLRKYENPWEYDENQQQQQQQTTQSNTYGDVLDVELQEERNRKMEDIRKVGQEAAFKAQKRLEAYDIKKENPLPSLASMYKYTGPDLGLYGVDFDNQPSDLDIDPNSKDDCGFVQNLLM